MIIMLINILLAIHLTLALFVVLVFGSRYYSLLKNKNYPEKGRMTSIVGSLMLIVSGITLSIAGNMAITGLCIDSLGLITALIVLEFGLQRSGTYFQKTAVVRARTDRK